MSSLLGGLSIEPTPVDFREAAERLGRKYDIHDVSHFRSALQLQAGMVERSPEKAGVGGSIPSLATTF